MPHLAALDLLDQPSPRVARGSLTRARFVVCAPSLRR